MSLDRAWIRVAALVAVAALSGCKSGTSFTKPSWWTFGGSGSGDPAKLAAAPPYADATKSPDGALQKPSAAATPYPTTTTPQGYVVSGSSGATLAAATASPAATDAPITYGKAAPPPALANAVPPSSTAVPGVATPAAAAPIGTQAGPYATLPTPSSTAPPMAAVPAPVTEPAFGSQPLARYADNRPTDSIAAPPAASAPPSQFGAPLESAPSAESRYGSATGSTFSREPAPFTAGSSSALPYSAPPAAPATVSPSAVPGAPPTRRPDPGYRPGGTSSYRPSRTILVGDPTPESAVRTAAFETPADPIRQ